MPRSFRMMLLQRGRLFEMFGAFVLGGGVVAVGYELARAPRAELDAVDLAAVPGDGAALVEVSAEPEAAAEEAAEGEPSPGLLVAPPPVPRAPHLVRDSEGQYVAFPPIHAEPVAFDEEAGQAFPQHAVVTSLGAIVRERPDLEAPILGVVRGGTRLRVDAERSFGGGCSRGWHRIFPMGWICLEAGMRIGETPPEATVDVPSPELDAPLPYEYWRVNEEMTPFFHRLPNFIEQERADVAGRAWHEEHGRVPMPLDPEARPEEVPRVVKEYMNAGYYVTKAGEEVRSERYFIRTTRGAYARKYQLGPKTSPEFRGQILPSAEALPLYFIRRELSFAQRKGEDSDVLVKIDEVPRRLSTHPFERMIHLGGKDYYEDADGKLMRAYAVSKAYKLKRPPGVGPTERWIHIDLSEQTLVAYEGNDPVFATLVSTGKEPGMTPVGIHRIQIKHVATSMRDQPVEEEAYSIDDVPWTQYFHGSIALHGAFWHAGFGLVRSHGCVNLSPPDARWLFGFTSPVLPADWYAVAPLQRGVKGSAVVVTE